MYDEVGVTLPMSAIVMEQWMDEHSSRPVRKFPEEMSIKREQLEFWLESEMGFHDDQERLRIFLRQHQETEFDGNFVINRLGEKCWERINQSLEDLL